MMTFKDFLTESTRRQEIKKLFENWNPDYDNKPQNEFGEDQKRLDQNHYLFVTLDDLMKSCQLDPEEPGPKIDSLYICRLHEVNKGSHFIVTIGGGANGSGDLVKYISLVKKLAKAMKEKFADVWLLDWANDCCDDIWTLRLCFKLKEDEQKAYNEKIAAQEEIEQYKKG